MKLHAQVLSEGDGPDEFWERFRTNLAASKVRLVFVADEIPPELRRLVEFLNEQMQTAEVLAVEVKQYMDAEGEHQTLVPRLVGQTERARQAKGTASADRWNRERLLDALEAKEPDAAEVARKIMEWAKQHHLQLWYGRGSQMGSVAAGTETGTGCWPFVLYTYGKVGIQFKTLMRRAPFDLEDRREELRARLNAIPGIDLPPDSLTRWPSFELKALYVRTALTTFLDTMGWVIDEVVSAETSVS